MQDTGANIDLPTEVMGASREGFSNLDKPFRFSTKDRLWFVVHYALSKVLFLWRDVKTPRLRVFIYEIFYSLGKLTKRPPPAMRWLRIGRVETTFGIFNVRPGTIDIACSSPAFERLDVDHLLALLEEAMKMERSVLFLDIGADLGTYSVAVANRLRQFGDIRVLAFEPSQSSFTLLKRNLEDNDLTGVVQERQVALWDGSETSATLRVDSDSPAHPGSIMLDTMPGEGTLDEQVTLSTVDDEMRGQNNFDILAIKMDVEGGEVPILVGATKTLSSAREVLLIVEDWVDPRVVYYLQSTGWEFLRKLTPYNSFWTKVDPNTASNSRK